MKRLMRAGQQYDDDTLVYYDHQYYYYIILYNYDLDRGSGARTITENQELEKYCNKKIEATIITQ